MLAYIYPKNGLWSIYYRSIKNILKNEQIIFDFADDIVNIRKGLLNQQTY